MQINALQTLRTSDDFSWKNVLRKRNIPEELLNDFLFPDLEYPWSYLENLDRAIEKLNNHIKNNSKILVVFDTDTDGVTSGTIIYRYLKDLGVNPDWVIGSGKAHGLTQHIKEVGNFDLIIACDSLSNEYSTYTEIINKDIEIILLDHHGAEPFPHPNVITVNSENFDYPNPTLSGAGVAYKFCQAYDETFGFKFADNYLDLAACGIIADVSSLSSLENRSICNKGLRKITNPGLKQLLNGYRFDANACAFSIATVINACNRLDKNLIAAQLLLSDDLKEIKQLYKQALATKDRQDGLYKQEIHEFNIQNSDGSLEHDKFVYFISSFPSLSGYVAQKLAEATRKPAIVLNQKDDCFSGSIRSSNVENFRDLCTTNYSLAQGHPEAAGIKVYDLKNFLNTLDTRMSEIYLGSTSALTVDYNADINAITTKIAKNTEAFNLITGKDFPQLTFYFENIIPDTITTMKDKHTKFTANDITFLLWNDVNLYNQYQVFDSPLINCVGTLSINKFRGKEEINFVISAYEITDFDPFI